MHMSLITIMVSMKEKIRRIKGQKSGQYPFGLQGENNETNVHDIGCSHGYDIMFHT